jgi:NhaP-type Na+/H+ or K+/H+ antiporter
MSRNISRSPSSRLACAACWAAMTCSARSRLVRALAFGRTLKTDRAAGSAISWDGHFNTQVEGEAFATVIDLILNCGCFVYIGAWLPFSSFNTPALGIELWKLFVLFVAILALRRIPALLLMYHAIPEITTWREALFSGHFGPVRLGTRAVIGCSRAPQMGVGAIFVSTLAVTRLPSPESPPQNQEQLLASVIQPIVSFVVLGSICIRTSRLCLISARTNNRRRYRWVVHPLLHDRQARQLPHGLAPAHAQHARGARVALEHAPRGRRERA